MNRLDEFSTMLRWLGVWEQPKTLLFFTPLFAIRMWPSEDALVLEKTVVISGVPTLIRSRRIRHVEQAIPELLHFINNYNNTVETTLEFVYHNITGLYPEDNGLRYDGFLNCHIHLLWRY